MSTIMFKCPCCGGYLEFDAAQQRFKCLYCGQVLTEDELREESLRREAEAEAKQEENGASQGGMKGYRCQMCGAEIVTEATTAATRCYFCHSPVVLQDRLDDDFRPDGVVPFVLDKETARQRFMEYIKSKKFVDSRFFDQAQLEMFTGVYYPFWYFDVEGVAEFEGQGTRRSVKTTSTHVITTTRFFKVERQAKMAFQDLARKALGKVDGKLADGIHPFDPKGVKLYAPGYLSGFLAETRDVEADELKSDLMQEVQGYADDLIRRNHTFNSLSGDTRFQAQSVKKKYVLLPVWVLTWKGGSEGAPYYYLMNGQTGKVCGKLPVSWKKLIGCALAAGAAVFALLLAGGKFIW